MPKDTPHILRAMSLNIWNYNPPWPRRRELIVRAVREADPDVIGFQEIRHDRARNDAGGNQAEQLAERLSDYCFVYRPAQRDPEREKGGEKEGMGRRIDYIFIRPSGEGRAGLLACRRIADRPAEDGRFPTDHFGLAADLRLEVRRYACGSHQSRRRISNPL